MTVEQQVQAILAASGGVTALCPSSRIRVPGDWQNIERPYIIHFPVSTAPIRTHTKLEAMQIWEYYQVSCVADTYSSARSLAQAVVAALDGVHYSLTAFFESEFTFKEPDSSTEQIALNFRIAFAQS